MNEYITQPYVRQVAELLARIQPTPGTVTEIQVLHDDGCSLLAGVGPCDCEPEVRVVNA